MNVQWRPYGWNQPGAEELPPLRKNANFVGVLMLALVGASCCCRYWVRRIWHR